MLSIQLFGRPTLRRHNQPLGLSYKAQALLSYLAVTRQAHSRQALAGLLWSDNSEERARRNLRVELARIRPLVGDYLLIQRRTIAFDLHSNHELDVAQFEACLSRPEPTLTHLTQATTLYHSHFLQDFHVPGAELFNEWVFAQRERLHQHMQQALLKLAAIQTQQSAYPQGIATLQQLLKLEPWLEEAHRQLMALFAHNGQRNLALKQYDLCRQQLLDELGVDPEPATTALYQDIKAGKLARLAPISRPARPIAPAPFQAPPRTPHFVGRVAELAQLEEDLTRPGHTSHTSHTPHIALVGMGGTGKTALATQLAHALQTHFTDGILWANATGDPLDILEAWGSAYGYDFSRLADLENRALAVRGLLANKTVLLILDNVAQVTRLRPLLPSGKNNAVLLTTRNLDVAHALNATILPLGELSPASSHQLLSQIVGEQRVSAEPEASAEIGRLLHYLPLAVEITAQRLRSRPRRRLADMAQRLRQTEQRLGLGISDRAIRASFEVSWEGLVGSLQRAFALLGVFSGRGFAAPALAHIAQTDLYTAEEHLFSLVALSLVQEQGQTYYQQHPLLADFATEKLGDNQQAPGRMATYYQQFATTHQANYPRLRPEWPNLMAGMETAHHQANWQLVLAYAQTLLPPWLTRARFSEMRQGLAMAQTAALALEDTPALAHILQQWGQAAIEQNNYEEATRLFNQSLAHYYRLEDGAGIATAQYHLARIALENNDNDNALDLLTQSQQLRQEEGDEAGVAATLYRQARVWFASGTDYQKAAELAQTALAIQETVADKQGQMATLRLLAEISLTTHQHSQAKDYCQQAHTLSQAHQDKGELAAVWYLFTAIHRRLGHMADSLKAGLESLALAQNMGNRRLQASILYQLSITDNALDNHEQAISRLIESIQLFQAVGDDLGRTYALMKLGDVYQKAGQDPHRPFEVWQTAQTLAISLNHPQLIEAVTQKLGRLVQS